MQTWFDQSQKQLDELHRQAETRQQAQQEAEQTRKRGAFALRVKTMDERLQHLWDSMPDDERAKRRQMSFFQGALAAKYRTRTGRNQASVAEIGPALTRLGWTRKREWLGAEQTFRTWWIPPMQENDQ